ncbi:MAG: tail fiber domain-containing protein [Alphaproteobacteria bacterium]|nr:tail fiber domain-containing protein [Alphaproteobacteria bacterium]
MGKFLQSLRSDRKNRGGFTLIELAIVLAITSLLAAGLWRMMATGNSQLRDQAAADQHKGLLNAVRGYLASTEGYNNILAAGAATFNLPLPAVAGVCGAPYADLCNYLPTGFSSGTQNSYNQTYEVQVLPAMSGATLVGYSFMIKTTAGDVIPDTSGGRISSMIGNDGGFVYTSDVCGGGGGVRACGAYGSWSAAPVADYSFGGVGGGQIASRTFVGLNASLNTPWLARQDVPGDTETNGTGEFNTMSVDMSLGGNTLWGNGPTGEGGLVDLTSPAASAEGETLINLVSCTSTELAPAAGTCGGSGHDVLSIQGRVGIKGLLKADTLYAGQFVYNTSDIRLKHDVVELDKVLDKMAQMKGYSFYLNEGGGRKLGVIAQEVEKVFPEAVMEIGRGYKGVDYLQLVGPLVESVNVLKERNDALAAKLEAQEKAIEQLKKEMALKAKPAPSPKTAK